MYDSEQEEVTQTEKISIVFGSIGKFILSFIETVVVALVISVVLYLFIIN